MHTSDLCHLKLIAKFWPGNKVWIRIQKAVDVGETCSHCNHREYKIQTTHKFVQCYVKSCHINWNDLDNLQIFYSIYRDDGYGLISMSEEKIYCTKEECEAALHKEEQEKIFFGEG